ncbi:MAG TPA: 16S rRNA (guanine(527)-N(7))-methyltransferase RsmG [Rhodopila sp.]
MNPATDAKLRDFATLLLRWNATLNLIAARDAATLWDRHIADSLQLVPLMPGGTPRAIDLGSGGGFPGLVLAIATGIPFDLIESDQRKASFLRTAILQTGAPATVHCCRIEDASVPPAPLVTARALAPLPRLLPLAARLLTDDGTCLFLKGAKAEDELAAATDWSMAVDRVPSQTGQDGVVLRITGLRRGGKAAT